MYFWGNFKLTLYYLCFLYKSTLQAVSHSSFTNIEQGSRKNDPVHEYKSGLLLLA